MSEAFCASGLREHSDEFLAHDDHGIFLKRRRII